MKNLSLVILLIGFTAINCAIISTEKTGTCPTPGGFGICIMGCQSDINCPSTQKCCSNGCGYTCQNPVTTIETQPILGGSTTSGSCPDTSGIFTICVVTADNCFSDSQCGAGQKCCAYGCGRRCLNVV